MSDELEILSEQSSPALPSPAWSRPRSPLPPHRLAKLANALGVSTPIPHHQENATNPSSPNPDRSPTPSTVSPNGLSPYSQATSKYLLHVIPPNYLPHDSADGCGASEIIPPSHASGYHAQFRRGTLVPMHPTLQAQLNAIAKEYALPSAVGMILYLVHSTQGNAVPSSELDTTDLITEPGPRLSEEIWKHLWNRVLHAERGENSRNPTPLGIGLIANASPYSPTEFVDSSSIQDITPLRPLAISQPRPYHFPPSPSTPSSVSDIPSQSKSAPPSSSSHSLSEPQTPDTSSTSLSNQADHLELPGLNTSSFIPVLAKVEFDIDKRKAGWFEPWLRSRKANTAKRTKSDASQEGGSDSKTNLLDLQLVDKLKNAGTPSFSLSVSHDDEHGSDDAHKAVGYGLLRESPEGTDSDGHVRGAEATVHVAASIPRRKRHQNPKIVNLALNAEDLAPLPEPPSVDEPGKDEQEVEDILEAMTRASKKSIPPPLQLAKTASKLPYLNPEPVHWGDPPVVIQRPVNEKRDGGVFDEYQLGLDELENDPDERKSQYMMKAKLDEIEKKLVQFSPRRLKTDSPTSSPSPQGQLLAPPTPLLNASVFPPTPPLASPGRSSFDKSIPPEDDPTNPAAWPAVPQTSFGSTPPVGTARSRITSLSSRGSPKKPSTPPLPPHLQPRRSTDQETESLLRRRDIAEQDTLYPSLRPPRFPNSPGVIPLSPDPFSRYSSAHRPAGVPDIPVNDNVPQPRTSMQNDGVRDSNPSRFSADSSTEDHSNAKGGNRTTLINVKGIKKLWRKSSKASVSVPRSATSPDTSPSSQFPPPPTSSPTSSAPFPQPSSPELLVTPILSRTSQPSPVYALGPTEPAKDGFYFDQESPYPMRRSPAPSLPPTVPTLIPLGGGPANMGFIEKEERGARKSILKSWKSPISPAMSTPPPLPPTTNSNGNMDPHLGMNSERYPPPTPPKPRRPSIVNLIQGRGQAPSQEIPPSPQIPQQFQYMGARAVNGAGTGGTTVKSKVSMEWDHSRSGPPPRSQGVASLRASGDTRTSVDVSQFEMVSPKANT